MIYLDNAATTSITPLVWKTIEPYLKTNFSNPSAIYSSGRQVRQAIEKARKQVADAIGASPLQIFFTSGATESNNIVCRQFDHVICSNIEHASVQGIEFNIFGDYTAQIKDITQSIKDAKPKDKTLISCQWVNNEIGYILPVTEICQLAHKLGLPFHTDATQAFCHVPINVKKMGCDFLSLSAHKFHAPKGIGILFIKEPDKFKSDIIGGGQEKGIRSGTENVAGIIGTGVAAQEYNYFNGDYGDSVANYQHLLKQTLIQRLNNSFWANNIIINSPIDTHYTDNIVNFSIRGVEGESLLLLLDNKGFCVSAGSACHSGDIKKSKVLEAIGVPDDYAYGTIRVSMSDETDLSEVDAFCNALFEVLKAL